MKFYVHNQVTICLPDDVKLGSLKLTDFQEITRVEIYRKKATSASDKVAESFHKGVSTTKLAALSAKNSVVRFGDKAKAAKNAFLLK